jgi:serine/threonine protein kinase
VDVDPFISLDEESKAWKGLTANLLERLSRSSPKESKHQTLEEIGRGGMGAVFKVVDTNLHRTLAMKVIREVGEDQDAASTDPKTLGRFLEEAQITGQLHHPGIVPVHELGLNPGGKLYFTMQLVKGQTFSDLIRWVESGKDGWNQTRALSVILDVLEALGYAHSRGVIHRDLKPANVMVGKFGETYVLDWGVARVLGKPDQRDLRIQQEASSRTVIGSERKEAAAATPDSPLLTMDGLVVGTPAYMSPEQALGMVTKLDARSDVYSVGAMLYQLLTGQMPYVPPGAAVSPRSVHAMVMQGPPRPLSELNQEVPAELVAICEKAMAREQDQRYASCKEMTDDLRAFLENRVVKAYQTGAFAELRKWVRRNRPIASLLAALFLLLPAAAFLGIQTVRNRQTVRLAQIEKHVQAGFRIWGRPTAEPALAEFERAIDLDPARIDAHVGIGFALLKLGRPEQLLGVLDAAPTAVRNHSALQMLQIDALRALGRDDTALRSQESNLLKESAESYFVTGIREFEKSKEGAGDLHAARKDLMQAVLRSPVPRFWFHDQAIEAHWAAGDNHGMREIAAAMMSLWPDHARSNTWWAEVLVREGRREEASEFYLEGCKLEPTPWHYRILGWNYQALKDFAKAEQAYRNAMLCNPGDPPAVVDLCRFLESRDRHEEAVPYAQDLVEIGPHKEEAHWLLIGLLEKVGNESELIAAYAYATERFDDNPKLLDAHAWELLTTPDGEFRNPKRALELATRSTKLDRNPIYKRTLGIALYRAGHHREALEVLQASDQENRALPKPANHRAFDLLFSAMCLQQLGNQEEAKQTYQLARELLPNRDLEEDLESFLAEAKALLWP